MSEVPVDTALFFDSSAVAVPDRFGAIQDVLVQNSHPTTLDMAGAPDPAAFRLRAWALAPNSAMFAASGPAMRMWRRDTRRHYDDESLFALSTQPIGRARVIQNDTYSEVLPGSLHLCDLGGAYDYSWSEAGSNISYQLTMDAVGLGRAEIAAAAPRLSASPLAGLLRDSLTDLHAYAQTGGPLYRELNQTITDLTRALIVAVLPDDPVTGLPDDDAVLWAALCSHVRRNLHQPSLSEASAAESLGIAPERLRQVAQARGVEVNDLITTRRLQRARAELVRQPGSILPARAALASAATRWGFVTPETLLDAMAAKPAGATAP